MESSRDKVSSLECPLGLMEDNRGVGEVPWLLHIQKRKDSAHGVPLMLGFPDSPREVGVWLHCKALHLSWLSRLSRVDPDLHENGLQASL